MLQAEHISYAIDGKTLLQPLTVALQPGMVTVVLGPNGAGKSTLLALLSGQYKPAAGCVRISTQPIHNIKPPDLACRRAVLPQDTSIAFDYTVRDVVQLGRYPHRLHPSPDEGGIATAAMHACEVGHLEHRVFNTLSGGEKARAQLARVLAQIWLAPKDGQSRWLLLDEPTAALDVSHQHQVMALARRWALQQGVGVVAVLHDVNLALRYADVVLLLQRGVLVASGRPGDVLDASTRLAVWGVQSTPVLASDGVKQLLISPAQQA